MGGGANADLEADMGPAESRSLEFLHCNAAARRPSHVQSSLQETEMMQSGFRLPRPVL